MRWHSTNGPAAWGSCCSSSERSVLLGSLFGMLGIKSLEGKTAVKPEPMAMKLVGAACALLGWVITLFGMHLTPSTGGRIVLALVGIGVSLFGIIVVLPAAFNKNAVWKS